MTFDEINECLKSGEMQLHQFPQGFIVTEIKQLAEERVLNVVWLSGRNFPEWMDGAQKMIKNFARAHKCVAIEAACRPGLAASLKQLGYRTIKRLVRAEV